MLLAPSLFAIDTVKYEQGQNARDVRINYKRNILTMALEKSVDEYGPYEIVVELPPMNSGQALRQLISGKHLNIFIAPTKPELEENAIPIRIPIRKGLLSYRILLINREDSERFREIKTVEQLKKETVGLQPNWTTTLILESQRFPIITGTSYDGLFKMLDYHRFNYIPRGVNEIYDELEQRKDQLHNVIEEPNLALYIPSPTYIFVSNASPKLAKRLEAGLEKMIADGSLDSLFNEHFHDDIERANLNSRTILRIENPLLTKDTPFERKELWFRP